MPKKSSCSSSPPHYWPTNAFALQRANGPFFSSVSSDLALLRPLWLTLCLAREVLAPAAKRALCRVFDRETRRCLKPKRRAHSRICGW